MSAGPKWRQTWVRARKPRRMRSGGRSRYVSRTNGSSRPVDCGWLSSAIFVTLCGWFGRVREPAGCNGLTLTLHGNVYPSYDLPAIPLLSATICIRGALYVPPAAIYLYAHLPSIQGGLSINQESLRSGKGKPKYISQSKPSQPFGFEP